MRNTISLSGKVKKTPSTEVGADRYNFLKLSEAEPDLGVPSTANSVILSGTDGTRSWAALPSEITVDVNGDLQILGTQDTLDITGTGGDSGDALVSNGTGGFTWGPNFTKGTYTTSSTGQENFISFSATDYRAAKYLITLEDPSGNFDFTEFNVMHDGNTVYVTEFAILSSSGVDIATLDAGFSSGSDFIEVYVTSTVSGTKLSFNQELLSLF